MKGHAIMHAPLCPHCGEPIDQVVDVPYGWWEWNGEKYVLDDGRHPCRRRTLGAPRLHGRTAQVPPAEPRAGPAEVSRPG